MNNTCAHVTFVKMHVWVYKLNTDKYIGSMTLSIELARAIFISNGSTLNIPELMTLVHSRRYDHKVSEYDKEITQSQTADQPTACTVRKIHTAFTVTRHPKDNKSKATSSIFLVKMTAKL